MGPSPLTVSKAATSPWSSSASPLRTTATLLSRPRLNGSEASRTHQVAGPCPADGRDHQPSSRCAPADALRWYRCWCCSCPCCQLPLVRSDAALCRDAGPRLGETHDIKASGAPCQAGESWGFLLDPCG